MDYRESQESLKQTFLLLKYTFIILPIATGLDKFFNILTNWEQYLNPTMAHLLPLWTSRLMMAIGVIEIAAGIIVFLKAEIGGYIVAAWLIVIALTLLLGFNYVDIAARDLVLAIGAIAMARLAKIVDYD